MSGGDAGGRPSPAVEAARGILGVRRLALEIHDASLPGDPGSDIGRGAPLSAAGLRFAAFVRATGFDALQLGPQGLTADEDPSPYTGTLFSRNPLTISLAPLADPNGEWGELLPASRLAELASARPHGADTRVAYAAVHRLQHAALGAAFERFERRRAEGDSQARQLAERLERFGRENAAWLDADALYEALRGEYGGRDWPDWQGPRAELDRALGDAARCEAPFEARRSEIAGRYRSALRFYRFGQLLAHTQHECFREQTRHLALELYGDLQVGASPRDTWRQPGIFLQAYRLGAPPSRTNPEGQPWDYPVLDPDGYLSTEAPDGAGPALRFVMLRIRKAFDEYDAVRVDHPQGLVCPWVYRAGGPDPSAAVRRGARLFSSPDLADHPELARYAIARRDQLAPDPGTPRYDDHWVTRLDPEQVERYARAFDRLVEAARDRGRGESALICEVLSTLPYPLERVLERHGLGRFRVSQKADPSDPQDVYRPENARPRDWIMFGNHDTKPLWLLLEEWRADGRLEGRAAAAAARLEPRAGEREAFRRRLEAEPGLLAHAEIAQLFASPAENVSVFFADLFGLTQVYNRPGTVSPDNWTLRLAPDWREAYRLALRRDRALNLPLALWLALRARPDGPPAELLRALREESDRVREGPPLP